MNVTGRMKRRGNRRLRRGFCPLCNSSPPYPECVVCQGSDEYGPNQSEPEYRRWRDRWYNLVGWPESGTKGLVVGHGQAPLRPPPPAPVGAPIRSLPALEYTGANAEQWFVFLRESEWTSNGQGNLIVETFLGWVTVDPGDWILRTRKGLQVTRPVLPEPQSAHRAPPPGAYS